MKMKNIAFFGVMASILSVAGANAATPTTVIATKSYVDTQVGTKADASDLTTHTGNGDIHVTSTQKTNWQAATDAVNNSTTGLATKASSSALTTHTGNGDIHVTSSDKSTWNAAVQTVKVNGTAVTKTSGAVDITVPTKTSEITNDSGFITSAALPTSSNFVSNGSNALTLTASTTKAPSVTAVQGMKTTTQRTATTGTDAATDDKVPTEKAVATALATKQNTITDLETIRTDASAGAGAATTISGYGNIVTHNTSEFATSTQGGKADTAVQTIKKNGTAVTKTDGVVDISVPTKVSQLTNDSSFATTTQVSTAKSEAIAGAAGGAFNAATNYDANTIGAAIKGKQATLSTAQLNAANSGITSTKVGNYDSHIADTDIHVTASDKAAWNAKQGALTTAQQNAVDSGITAAKVSTYDGYATTISGKVTANTAITAKTGNNLVSYDAKGLVTGGTTAGALATKSTIADADVATGADIVYTKMKAPTATINGGTANCTTSAPCVLSYDGSSYSWTTFAY